MNKTIESDVLEYLQKNCRGYENRMSGNELEFKLDYNYKRISDSVIVLNLSGEPVFNLNDGYFYLGKENNTVEDLTALLQLNKLNNKKYEKLNLKKATIQNALRKLNNMEIEL